MTHNKSSVLIGIDIGTSYAKVVFADRFGAEIVRESFATPSFRNAVSADTEFGPQIHSLIKKCLIRGLSSMCLGKQPEVTVCISGISPVLIAFEPENPEYALALPYWRVPSLDITRMGLERTIHRIKYLRNQAETDGHKDVVIADLLGYLVFRFTEVQGMNCLTSGELGFDYSHPSDQLNLFVQYFGELTNRSPADICGFHEFCLSEGRHVSVAFCAGMPDTFAAAVSTASTSLDSLMIYLGTFGSLLLVNEPLTPIVTAEDAVPRHPYQWILSVPGFGRQIEGISRSLGATSDLLKDLRKMDELALSSSPGCHGSFLRLPTWDKQGSTLGRFEFHRAASSDEPNIEIKARAALESLGHRVLASHGRRFADDPVVHVSGGGTRSRIWLQILADVLGCRVLSSSEQTGGAMAAARLAGVARGYMGTHALAPTNLHLIAPNDEAHRLSEHTTTLAMNAYSTWGEL